MTGLLTERPNKNCDTPASVVPDTSEQRLHGLLTSMDWDEHNLNRQRVQSMLRLPSEGDGVLIFNDTGFANRAASPSASPAGYSGTRGKTGNCQVAVNCLPLYRADDCLARRHPVVPTSAMGRRRRPSPEDQGTLRRASAHFE